MNAMTRGALSAYAQVGVETSIASASPHKLITLLYDGALVAISCARAQMINQEVAQKGASISKAIAIIEEGLKASLDEQAGGELAVNFKSLYDYMAFRLLNANLQNDVAGLDEVSRLLTELKDAWVQIGLQPKGVAPSVVDQPVTSARPSTSYGKA